MSAHKIIALRSGTYNGMDWDAEYEIAFEYRPGAAPIFYPIEKADPGHPAELELISVKPVIGTLDHGAFTDLAQNELDCWAADWLEGDGRPFDDLAAERVT